MPPDRPVDRERPDIQTSSDGEPIDGIDRKSALLVRVNIVVLTPIPSANVRTAPMANIGLRARDRAAYLKSPVITRTCSFRAKGSQWIAARSARGRDPRACGSDLATRRIHDRRR